MTFIYPTYPAINFSRKLLIIPIVSAANVAQLAADILIATLRLQRVAVVDPSFFVPVVGGREDGLEGISTSLEVYGKEGLDILIMQQRSPVLKSRKQEFVPSLLQFIQTSSISGVLFLSGVDPTIRTDAQMITTTYQIIPQNSQSLTQTNSFLKNLLSLQIPPYMSPVSQQSGADVNNSIPFMPGGGLTRRILSSLPEGWQIPTATLLQFVLEGDNRSDSSILAAVAAKATGLDTAIKEWKQPQSWQEGLFGAPHDQTLYG